MSKKIKMRRSCFFCSGSGQTCNQCGESSGACDCDAENFYNCPTCAGTGIATADMNAEERKRLKEASK